MNKKYTFELSIFFIPVVKVIPNLSSNDKAYMYHSNFKSLIFQACIELILKFSRLILLFFIKHLASIRRGQW